MQQNLISQENKTLWARDWWDHRNHKITHRCSFWCKHLWFFSVHFSLFLYIILCDCSFGGKFLFSIALGKQFISVREFWRNFRGTKKLATVKHRRGFRRGSGRAGMAGFQHQRSGRWIPLRWFSSSTNVSCCQKWSPSRRIETSDESHPASRPQSQTPASPSFQNQRRKVRRNIFTQQ